MNMRQHRLLEVVKDYKYEILYHPGEVNVVVDSLSCKSASSLFGSLCMSISIVPPLLDLIKGAQTMGVKKEHQNRNGSGVRLIGFPLIFVDC